MTHFERDRKPAVSAVFHAMREYKTGMTPTSEERVAFNVTYETFYDTYGNVYEH